MDFDYDRRVNSPSGSKMIDAFVIKLKRHEIYTRPVEIWLDLKPRIYNKATQITKRDKKSIRRLSGRIRLAD